MKKEELQNKIRKLKKEKDALVLAHYYVPVEVQEIADHVGDSFALAKLAKGADAKIIVMCGVKFMAESAKILSPDKKVLLPDMTAGCPMADMATPEDVRRLREEHPKAVVMSYVISSDAVKGVSDICCTSSSALKAAAALKEKEIVFVPDMHLGEYTAQKMPDKTFFVHNGYCPVHHGVTEADVIKVKKEHPNAAFAVHPECRAEVLKHAEFIGSTAEILDFAKNSEYDEIIIGTENTIVEILTKEVPGKKFYTVSPSFVCGDMKKITLEAVLESLEKEQYEITLTKEEIEAAAKSLDRMVNIK